ncbi:MAG: arginine decarboxylase, pyruvoyl-dependent [Candidatus Omnitrophica bacterium]|nr:arginine decarboxylase, pyruvoyl-dependent [Candidatus Omnitrophota bacterium]
MQQKGIPQNLDLVPKGVFFTKGVGKHKYKLRSFELALRKAGIERFNLVAVSSILPPHCRIVTRKVGLKHLKSGQVVFAVMAQNATNEPNRLVASSIGLAVPADHAQYGYLSEHHSFGEKKPIVDDHAEDLAATMLASTMGLDLDPDKAWDERKQLYVTSGRIIKTNSVTQTAIGDKNGLWTTVIAAAVFFGLESNFKF